jgi:DNA-directed RNA polymerase specialized sigma24 family protein
MAGAASTPGARLGLLGQPGAQPDETGAVDNRDQLLRQLRQLPARQRTAIVLRYWEELTSGCGPRWNTSPCVRGRAW